MKIDHRVRRNLRLQNILFTLLVLALVGLAGWLAHAFSQTADWTATGRHTLGDETREIIALVDGTVEITAYIGPEPVTRRAVAELIERYERAGLDLRLDFVNPETNPTLARELELSPGGEIVLRFDEQQQRLQHLDEAELTNALARLVRGGDRYIAFVEGHGERDPLGDANHDLGQFSEFLGDRGIHVQTINLARMPHVPDNADLLVIASPRSDYLPGEIAALQRYLDDGRNLLWLADNEGRERLQPLADLLGIERLPGVVVDAGAQAYGAQTPDFAVLTGYPDHSVTSGFGAITVFPQAMALEPFDAQGWRHQPLLRTRAESWNETGPIAGRIAQDPDAGEVAGPLNIGIAATRGTDTGHANSGGQRMAVIGDGDFLANAYVGNGGNLELGSRLFSWLIADDDQIEITPDRPADIELDMSTWALGIIGFGFLLVLPASLLATGLVVWWRRHKR